MKTFKKVKIEHTKLEKGINYFGSTDSIYVDGQLHNVGSRVLALCVLSEKDGWKNRINFQEGLQISGDIDRSASLYKDGKLYVVAINGAVFYLENNTWITEHAPDDTLAKKWLFKAFHDPENDRIVVAGGNSGKPGGYSAYNSMTYVYENGKWAKFANKIHAQEGKENIALRKSRPYEHISDIDFEFCYDHQLKQMVMLGVNYSYTLNGKKWEHHESKGIGEIALSSRKIFHVKALEKTFILTADGTLYQYSKESITPYANIDLKDLTFYNCGSHYSDEKGCLFLTDSDGSVFTVEIS
ncbi:hypothetical protein DNU06_15950 [Putridiphycobacter roseus]|uniref:Uncharacterized protein n=1 Tax=Putridiphycobacter roseus TaxID=2219161 RepID=A0A2W1MZ68_9FLAO|nr:hypothetical protein [Putridiphycobacter roseus]PZE15871.1 hypothetical protein DNU06_15950 [Putridiphycobacter roseus]